MNVNGNIHDIPVAFAAFGRQLQVPKQTKEVSWVERESCTCLDYV